MAREVSFDFKILIKKEGELWVAHCLELDIVATADTRDQAQDDIEDLIAAQVNYALENDNLEYLYHSAPAAVWREFLGCENRRETRHSAPRAGGGRIVPLIVTNTCHLENPCSV